MYKAVIVDDENIVRVALGTIIDWHAYQFEVAGTAANGEEAVRLIGQKQVDLVVTDLKMPGMNGLDLIESLKKEGFDGEIIILSNYDDFEMVRKGLTLGAADYLLKFTISPESFAEVLEKIKARLDEKSSRTRRDEEDREEVRAYRERKVLREWQAVLLGEAEEPVFSQEQFLPQKGKSLLFFRLQTEYENSTWRKAGDQEKDKFLPSVTNIVKGLFEEDKELYVIPVEEAAMAVLYRGTCGESIKRQEKAEQIASLLGIYLNVQASVVYSEWFDDPRKAAELYRLAGETLEACFYRREPVIAKIKKAERKEGTFRGEYPRLLQQVTAALKNQDFEECGRICREIGTLAQANGVSPGELRQRMERLIKDCALRLFDGRVNWEVPDSLLGSVRHSASFAALSSCLDQAFRWLSEELRQDKYSGYRREVAEILQYIDLNTDKKLTLSEIAQQVSMNESYMCTIFKEQVGKSIISYINEKKMQLAVELIETTDIYIKEVASKVGISDPFYFNRLFKKYYGVTPSKYKEGISSAAKGEDV